MVGSAGQVGDNLTKNYKCLVFLCKLVVSRGLYGMLENILNIQALMCVALMSILYSVGTSSRSWFLYWES
jgi:hypothetical protein